MLQERLNTTSPLRRLLQEEHDVLPDILRLGARVVAHEWLAALGDEELFPIPADVLGLDGAVVEVGRVRKALARGRAVSLESKQTRYHPLLCPVTCLVMLYLPVKFITCLNMKGKTPFMLFLTRRKTLPYILAYYKIIQIQPIDI